MQQLMGYLRLMRPANIITAVSDVLAGVAIAAFFSTNGFKDIELQPVLLLVLSTTGLYSGGVVFNDVFDAELDKKERPERPIPSGLIRKNAAALFAFVLLLLGVIAAALVHPQTPFNISAFLALATAVAAVLYDKWAKHHSFLGPVNMGLCRGLNLLLGISILPAAVEPNWMIALVPVLYIAAITFISRGEVHGGSKSSLYLAMILYLVVVAAILNISWQHGNLLYALPFTILFAFLIFKPLRKAVKEPTGPRIGKAVKAGVISLIVMNAAWAAAFGWPEGALLILLLLPVSLGLARLFAVT